MNDKLKRLMEIHDELHDIANDFAIAGHGNVGVEIHQTANNLGVVKRMIEEGVGVDDKLRQAMKWVEDKPGMTPEMKAMAVRFLVNS